MFFRKSYIKGLLKAGSITGFVEGINADPASFFKEANKDPREALRSLAAVIDMAGSNLGQSAVVLSLVGTLKIAAKDKKAPEYAPKLAQALTDQLMAAFKNAK